MMDSITISRAWWGWTQKVSPSLSLIAQDSADCCPFSDLTLASGIVPAYFEQLPATNDEFIY